MRGVCDTVWATGSPHLTACRGVDTGYGFDRSGHPAGDGPSIAQGVSMKHNSVAALALLGLCSFSRRLRWRDGLGRGRVTRTAGTGDAYTAWKASAPPIPPGSGRLFVYAPNRQVSIWTADWATGGEFVFDVDRDVCDVIGSSFAYVDLPAGVHSLSASEHQEVPRRFPNRQIRDDGQNRSRRTTFAPSILPPARRRLSPSAGPRCGWS